MKKSKINFKKFPLIILIPIIVFVIATLTIVFNLAPTANYFFYDLFLKSSKAPKESESILLLDIDDDAIERRSVWPWRRGIYGDCLFILAEFGAESVIFDIEFSEQSPSYVDPDFFQSNILEGIDQSFDLVGQSISELYEAYISGRISENDILDYLNYTVEFVDMEKDSLISNAVSGVYNNDLYFGNSLRVFSNAVSAISLLNEESSFIDGKTYDILKKKIINNVIDNKNYIFTSAGIRIVQEDILAGLSKVGFSNVIIDKDGKRRRVKLLTHYDDFFIGQLAFNALYNHWQGPEIKAAKNKIIIKDIDVKANGSKADLVIPLDSKGNFLIKWPKKKYFDSYRHLSFWYLLDYIDEEKNLIHDIQIISDEGYRPFVTYNYPLTYVENFKEAENALLESGNVEEILQYYREEKSNFYLASKEYFSEENIEDFINKFVDFSLTLGAEEAQAYLDYASDLAVFFENVAYRLNRLEETRSMIEGNLKDSICIIGNTATATTDRGVNPFDSEFENTGTHASVINSILNKNFIKEVNHNYSILILFFLLLAIAFVLPKLKSYWQVIAGFGLIIASFLVFLLLFVIAGIYIFTFEILLGQVFVVLGIYIYTFAVSSKEKAFIKSAFGHYLSPEVIANIVANPTSLKLGGVKKHMTVMFTDVKGFSTIAEELGAEKLVKLLNMYLSDLSDEVLNLGGTIDKYEGDAIMCFFGAPLDMENHVELSCLAAIRMKKAEQKLNTRLLEEGFMSTPLLTRIGVNTGDMVVGNMGTIKKMDYTVMGNAVNLAARLEGVNKQYGTWVLISEDTYEQGGKKFLCRKLDRVRVVGINQPIRLYELVDEHDKASDTVLKGLSVFDQALTLFEERKWAEAEKLFIKVKDYLPEDEVANRYINCCKGFIKEEPAADWDGVFNLTQK